MATSSKTDLFVFGAHGQKPLHEHVTPHKMALLSLIFEYCEMKKRDAAPQIVAIGQLPGYMCQKFTETEKRDFMTSILRLLQSPDLSLKELLDQVQTILQPTLLDNFTDRLREFYMEGVLPFMDFFQELQRILQPSETLPDPVIVGSSVLGLFLRRMIHAFDKLSFSQVTKLYTRFKDYYEAFNVPQAAEESDNFGGSLIDSITSQCGLGKLTRSGLAKSYDPSNLGEGKYGEFEGGFYSHKQAEYFISRQGFLLQHNESEALSPTKLQEKITDMLKSNPDIAEAHFLSYLNNLRVREYCTAVHNLYHYFDRNNTLSGGNAMQINSKNREEDNISRRYAALNLAALHFRFGHRDESLAALKEAISMAQETNDHVCLQHALSWQHRIEEPGSARTASLMAQSIGKSLDLTLPNITSLGIQALARHNAFATAKPASVFDFLLKSDILNCQHSQSHFMCVSYAQKGALWNMYGKRENSSMSSQLVLNLDTSDSGIYHNGESVCISLCDMAKHFSDQGYYNAALEIINTAKQRFPSHTQHAHIWMSCEQEIQFDKTLLNRNWTAAEQAVNNLRGLDQDEACLRSAILNKEKGDIPTALASLHSLMEKYEQNQTKYTPDYSCRVLLTLAELYIQTGNHTSALSHVLDCLTHAKEHHLQYIIAIATVHLAFIQFQMKLPEQALKLLHTQMVQILSHGSVYDQARTMYCYARCQVAANADSPPKERKTALLLAVNMIVTVIEKFKKIDASLRVKDATYYLARLYNELGYTSERNKCAYQFRQLDQQYPTQNRVIVNAL